MLAVPFEKGSIWNGRRQATLNHVIVQMYFSDRKKRDAYYNAFVVLKSESAEFDESRN